MSSSSSSSSSNSTLNSLSSYKSAISSSPLVVLIFVASWHEPAQAIKKLIPNFINDFKNVAFYSVDVDEAEELTEKFNVNSAPTTIAINGGTVVSTVEGADPPQILKLIQQLAATPTPTPTPTKTTTTTPTTAATATTQSAESDEVLNGRLSILISSSPVMIFIKGSPSAPRCGFSRQLVDLLKPVCKFSYFDILTDSAVREGLKKFSNWPTYPQVYVSGELVGGLDVVKELLSSGEFVTMLPKEEALTNTSSAEEEKAKSTDITTRLKQLINKHKVVLFMKGTRSSPKCGFSSKAIAMLDECGVAYDTFDILSDLEVREQLKIFSNWPTYPQLYVSGELIGGVDVMTELHAAGDLKTQLQQ